MDEEELADFSLVLNRTPEDIQQEIGDMVLAYPNIQNPVEICEKLLGQYVVIQELYQISKGRYIRWINPENGKLVHGGIVLDVQFKQETTENENTEENNNETKNPKKTGVYILCKSINGGVFYVQYSNTLIFQKLKPREVLYLELLGSQMDKN